MNLFSKIVVLAMIVLCGLWIKDTFFKDVTFNLTEKISSMKPEIFNDELPLSDEGKKILGDKENPSRYENVVRVYFLRLNNDGTSAVYVSKRDLKDVSLTAAIKALLKGPTYQERNDGVYTEIPNGTKLLSVMESENKVIINLNSDFQYGGGTESVNNRLKQLVKTVVNFAPDKNLYLYLDGKQVEVIGGEGIMITQPLNVSDFSF